MKRAPSWKRKLKEMFRVYRFGTKAARWTLDGCFGDDVEIPDGYFVEHCGHPTANYPYHGETPSGEMLVASNGRGFRHLHDAMFAVALRAINDRARTR